MELHELCQKAEQALRSKGYEPTKWKEGGTYLKNVVDLVYPLVAQYINENGVVIGKEFEALGRLFYDRGQNMSSKFAHYTATMGDKYGVHVTRLEEVLREDFGKFHKVSGSGIKGKSYIFYASRQALSEYLKAHAKRRTRFEGKKSVRKRIIALDCSFPIIQI